MTRVVLLGGGYVTLHAYAALAARLGGMLRRGEVELVVITADRSHSYHGFTGEVLAGLLPYERTRTPVARACPKARVEHGVVVSVDRDRRTLTWLPAGETTTRVLGWDHLVVGLGGREPSGHVPGLDEHGWTLRGPGDIRRLAARVEQLTEAPDEDALDPAGHAPAPRGYATAAREDSPAPREDATAPREDAPLVVVAGGGLAGVELAAAIADRGRGRLRAEVVQGGATLVPEFAESQPRLARRVEEELDRLGVGVRCGVRVVEVGPEHATLSDGTVLASAAVIATTGQRAVRLPGLGDGLRDLRGRLVTAPDLSVVDGVWAAGDAARVAHPVTGEPVAANALWAIKAGRHVGANVARTIAGRPTRPFRYRGLGRAASFGLGRSVAELYGVPFTGVVAWLLRLVFFLRFMPDRRVAFRTLADTLGSVRDRTRRRLPRQTATRRRGGPARGPGTGPAPLGDAGTVEDVGGIGPEAALGRAGAAA